MGDAVQDAADKITSAARVAEDQLAADAREAAVALSGEVVLLREEMEVMRKVDNFKAKVYVIGIIAAALEIGAFASLWVVSKSLEENTAAIRTDLEVHRIRNEASHDCLAEKMAKLPSPEQREAAAQDVTREFLHEFLGCVADVAPTIVPPGAAEIRVTTEQERQEREGRGG